MTSTFSESTWFFAQPSVVSQTVGVEGIGRKCRTALGLSRLHVAAYQPSRIMLGWMMNHSARPRYRERIGPQPDRTDNAIAGTDRRAPGPRAARTAVRRIVAVLTAHGPNLPEAVPDLRNRPTR